MSFFQSILPIIVLYNQNLANSLGINTLNDILEQRGDVLDLFVYDNSPIAQYEGNFNYKNFKVQYVHDVRNSGVSKAYNEGANYARTKGKKWVLLLDQDTKFTMNFLDSYEKAIKENESVKIFAPVLKTQHGQILSPCRYYHKRGYWPTSMSEGLMDVNQFSPINSGMMINTRAFFEVGGYNEDVKLDFADFQFIERFGKRYTSFYVLDLICEQDFSGFEKDVEKLKHRFGFFCQGAKNCKRESWGDHFWYLMVVLRRMLGLILKSGNISFLCIFYKNYLFSSHIPK
jgi:GT2 family glycosyltransferase